MMHLFINSIAASAGGGLTYIRNLLPQLGARDDVRATVAVNSGLREELDGMPNLDFVELQAPVSRRFVYEQSALAECVRRSGADVLLSTGNFALWHSPVPQILLSRNSIYTSPDFYRDVLSRHEYRLWLETKLRGILAKKSIDWADATVAPSEAFAEDLRRWTDRPVIAIHHGFDYDAFTRNHDPLAKEVHEKVAVPQGALKLLFVSHYNYYRNFETLIRSLPILRDRFARPVKLLLTCRLRTGENPGSYRTERAASLVKTLGVSEMLVELGSVPYGELHQLYRSADLYVTPAYTETFAHPLVEAMSCGIPIVASDLAVHREICGEAAVYFPRFSHEDLAESVLQVAASETISQRMVRRGLDRSRDFSWKQHLEKLLVVSRQLIAGMQPVAAD